MSNETQRTAEELVKAIKDNLLKPMYNGINNNTNQRADEIKLEFIEMIEKLATKLNSIKSQQDSFIEALKNVKWED
jgi:hypothetical protein